MDVLIILHADCLTLWSKVFYLPKYDFGAYE